MPRPKFPTVHLARYYGEIENSPEAVRRLVARLDGPGEQLKFC